MLPKTEKRTSATLIDLFLIKSLCKFKPLELPTLMLEHMNKIVIEQKGKNGMGNGYLLTKLFKYLNIPLGVGKVGTAKKSFTDTTMVECECLEGKGNPKSKVSQLIAEQDQMKHELEEMTMRKSNKDAEIAILKSELLKA